LKILVSIQKRIDLFLGIRCYRYFNEDKTWLDAQAHCHKNEANLVIINHLRSHVFEAIYNITNPSLKSRHTLTSIWVKENPFLINKDLPTQSNHFFRYLNV
jgi:hypothetical protein